MLSLLRCLTVGCVLAVCANAQSASVTYYGSACGPIPPSGSPDILVSGVPKLGGQILVGQTRVQPQIIPGCTHWGHQWLLIGASRHFGWGQPLPFDLPLVATGGFKCNVWSSGELIGATPLNVPLGFVIPSDPLFLGMRAYLQWFVYYWNFGPGCSHMYERWMTSYSAELVLGY